MKTRCYEKRKPEDIVRRCIKCGITDNDIAFLVQKCNRSKKYFKHSICKVCYLEIQKERRRKYYLKNKEKEILKSSKWNKKNKEAYNKRRRIPFLLKFYKSTIRRQRCPIV